jgi:hypothetical protein
MTEPRQLPYMDAKELAERQIIERYLANQLSDAEALEFKPMSRRIPRWCARSNQWPA